MAGISVNGWNFRGMAGSLAEPNLSKWLEFQGNGWNFGEAESQGNSWNLREMAGILAKPNLRGIAGISEKWLEFWRSRISEHGWNFS
jgi:hypothetical protein